MSERVSDQELHAASLAALAREVAWQDNDGSLTHYFQFVWLASFVLFFVKKMRLASLGAATTTHTSPGGRLSNR